MKKIPTIFKRNPANMRELLNELHPDCLWVSQEGVARRKYDGTCVKIEKGKYFRRREVKKGRVSPIGFIVEQYDSNTGKTVGWVEVDSTSPEDKHHMEAFNPSLPDGTYELVGPKVQKNPEKFGTHTLVRHSEATLYVDVPREFHSLAEWLRTRDIEGIVFYHPDGRMGKIKNKDFGQRR